MNKMNTHIKYFIALLLILCICPPIKASGNNEEDQIVSVHHVNDPATYHARYGGGSSSDSSRPVSPQVTTKAVIRHPAPLFVADSVINGELEKVSLSSYLGKYVVLLFYPADFSFVCPTELIGYSDRIKEFKAINTEVLAISVDSKFSHLAWTKLERSAGGLGSLDIPIVSDITKTIARDYGVLIDDGPDAGVSFRGIFIIDDKGILRQTTINDLPVGRDVDETLRLISAFQFASQNEVVCPAGWKPGKDTIKANPKDSLSFFEKLHSKN
eukprot:TRINITY_DN1036_c0_g1_i1.p1 TRINITY_DN1036_c0_g1~~TRINITY_DN1036_c0_g1_i1.p1  ORF type:complete len:270 (-),score=71.80 TRINITY_DN1036_c0_g1_i1:35-844(-)